MSIALLASAALLVAASDRASVQDERVRVAVSLGGTAGHLGSEVAYGGSVSYRFSGRSFLEIEVSGLPDVQPQRSGTGLTLNPPIITPSPLWPPLSAWSHLAGFSSDARSVLMTANLRQEFFADNERVRPYVTAGFGIVWTRTESRFSSSTTVVLPPLGLNVPNTLRFSTTRPPRVHEGTDLAVVVGGGTGVRLIRSLFLDLDARYYRLLDPGRDVGRFGSGLSYRF